MKSRDRGEQPTIDTKPTAARIDELCNQFEEAWQTAGPPSLSDYLKGWREPARSELLRELVQVDVYYRRKTGQPVELSEYLSLDPASEDWLQQLLGDDPTRSIRDLAEETRDFAERGRALDFELPSHADYVIESEIARGGMGRVLAGRELRLEREVAIKTLLPEANASRFLQEAKITARLQHPGIPPVYALGTLSDGSPFLAMKLVRGQTLADELSHRTSPLDDLTHFLTVFEQIAQAVGFAHAQEIVHRDLKPANIMVGAFGEVHVMDWGLARDAQSAESSPDENEQSPGTGEVQRTRVGAVFGTPSYMPPEQARGEVVDARADVFALGGILAAILTGQPPFLARTVRETLDQAAEGDTTRVVDLLHSSSADEKLVEIAVACLHADPIRRPLNGEEVAELIGSYRNHVEQRLRQAEADQAANAAKATEEKKRHKAIRIAAGIVIGVLIAGIIGTSIGLVNANVAWNAEKNAKDNLKIEYDRAESALKDVRSSIDRYVDVVQNEDLLRDPRFKDIIPTLLEEALGQYERYVKEYGAAQDAETRAEVANALARIGIVHKRTGQIVDALAAYHQALAIRQRLAIDHPESLEYKTKVPSALNNIGILNDDLGQHDAAWAAYSEARQKWSEIAEAHPELPYVRDALAAANTNLGLAYMRQNKSNEAHAALHKSLDLRSELLDQNPESVEWQLGKAESLINLGIFQQKFGDAFDALTLYEDASHLLEAIPSTDFQTNLESKQILARCYANIGKLHFEQGGFENAFDYYTREVAIAKQLVDLQPNTMSYREQLANAHGNLGLAMQRQGKPNASIAATTDAIAELQELVERDPETSRYRHSLSRQFNDLGLLHMQTSQPEQASAAFVRSIELVEEFAQAPDASEEVVILSAGSYVNLGLLQRGFRGDLQESIKSFSRAIEMLHSLPEESERESNATAFLRNALWNRAQTYHALEIYQAAVSDFREVLPLMDRSLRNRVHIGLAKSYVKSGQHEAAASEARIILQRLDDTASEPAPEREYEAACVLASAANAVSSDINLSERDRRKLCEVYALEATRAIEAFVTAGYFDSSDARRLLREDSWLDPIRDRPDFQSILENVDKSSHRCRNLP